MNMISRIQGIVAIAALVAGGAGMSRAQSTAAPEQKQKPAAEKKTEAVPEEAKEKGGGEGIKVHGHWTIEVKDPDGKVATHREFENSLQPPAGPTLLADLLLGYLVNAGFGLILNDTPLSGATVTLNIDSPNWTCSSNTSTSLCSNTLTAGPISNGLSISGQISNAPGGSITAVYSEALSCLSSSNPPTPITTSPAGCAPFVAVQFTGTTLATSIPVTSGQTVQVTVQITFQ